MYFSDVKHLEAWPLSPPPSPFWWCHGIGHYSVDQTYGHANPRGFPYFSTYLTLSGAGRYRFHDQVFDDGPAQLTMLPHISATTCWGTAAEHWDFCWMVLHDQGACGWTRQFSLPLPLRAVAIDPQRAQALALLHDELTSQAQRTMPASDMGVQRQAFELFALLVEAARKAALGPPAMIGGKALMHEVARYLEREQPSPDRVEDLARRLGASPEHVSRAMRAATGVAPKEWFLRHRMREAQRLLTTTDLPVAEIGARVGYPDPFHFSRLFRARLGMPPRSFRAHRPGF
jgi:AraC family transcriptional regulator of arabinose operon